MALGQKGPIGSDFRKSQADVEVITGRGRMFLNIN